LNFLLFIIIIFAFYVGGFKKVFWLAFAFGLVNDLILANLVGFSSLVFLTICFLVFLYQEKFSSSHLFFQLSFIILADLFFTWINKGSYSLKQNLLVIGLSLIILSLVNRMKGKELEIPNF